MFWKKLDCLMNITKTTNTALALALSVVPSYVSRLRNGQRTLPANSDLIKPISRYFSRKLVDDPKMQQLVHAYGSPEIVAGDVERTAKILSHWLTRNEEDTNKTRATLSGDRSTGGYPPQSAMIYYGISGKQEAVMRFLSEVLAEKKPQTLLLYSDENLSWLADPVFFSTWKRMMMQILKKGNRIKIIHHINRGARDIEVALRGWIPLYTTDLIDPYYCPTTGMESVHRRTLFIAPETAVISSVSVQENIQNTPNIYITDPETIEAFIAEYENYTEICKPLMQKFSSENNREYLDILDEWEQHPGILYLLPEYLSAMSLPVSVLRNRGSILGTEKIRQIEQRHLDHSRQFALSDIYDLILLPDPKDVIAGKIRMPLYPYPDAPDLRYTVAEFRDHLYEIIRLLRNFDRYQVTIRPSSEPYAVNVKADAGVLLLNVNTGGSMYFFNEPGLIDGFSKELRSKTEQNPLTKSEVIEKLEKYISSLSIPD